MLELEPHHSTQEMQEPTSICALFEACVKKNPNDVAIVNGHDSLSYADLNKKANQFAHYLASLNIQKASIIAISIPRSPELLVAVLGILKAGHAYLPLDESHPVKRLAYLLDNTEAPLLVTPADLLEKYSFYQGRQILIDTQWPTINTYSTENPIIPIDPHALAYVIYTSGSTGKPKGVLIEHQSLVNYTLWFSQYSACRPQDKIDFSSNFIFDMAVTSSITALALQLQIVICPEAIKQDPLSFLNHLQTHRIHLIKITPSYFKLLQQEAQTHTINLPNLQAIILGGENLSASDCIHWLEHYPMHQLFNEYGPTETTVAVSHFKVTRHTISQLETNVPIGKPGRHVAWVLLDEQQQPVSPGEFGELYIRGRCLARGYLKHIEPSTTGFLQRGQDRWYKTGDLCRELPTGDFLFIQRVDEQVKLRGYRIEQGEIETLLNAHPCLKNTVVLVQKDQHNEPQLMAYCIPKSITNLPNNQELRLYLRQYLADYMIPSKFVMMDQLPLTANGKLDKKTLLHHAHFSETPLIYPQTPLEQSLVDIWKDAFHHDKIGINSGFFELGGHSLTAARIIAACAHTLNKKVTLHDLYQSNTIQAFAVLVESAEKVQQTYQITPQSPSRATTIPLSDFQFLFWFSRFFEPNVKKLNVIARRRFKGWLDETTLTAAFHSVFKTHEVLCYRLSTFSPSQYLQKNLSFHIITHHLQTYTKDVCESLLTKSLHELLQHHSWKKNAPLLIAKLFYLNEGESELQVSVAHVIFDDVSENILFTELSNAYLLHQNKQVIEVSPNKPQYRHYVAYERNVLNQQLNEDIRFWESYLQNTHLVAFQPEHVVQHPLPKSFSYSTYLELPQQVLKKIQHHMTCFHVSMTDLICAAIGLSLKKMVSSINQNTLINIIRSTRDHDELDQLIGCFIRLDPLKVNLHTTSHLIELAKQIQRSRIQTETHQACSSMVKFACLNQKDHNKRLKRFIMDFLAKKYTTLFPKAALNPTMLAMYGRLNALKKKKRFMININILNNFIQPIPHHTLFGFEHLPAPMPPYDLSKMHEVLDICLLRQENTETVQLVLSGNLTPNFREQLGHEIIHMIYSSSTEQSISQKNPTPKNTSKSLNLSYTPLRGEI